MGCLRCCCAVVLCCVVCHLYCLTTFLISSDIHVYYKYTDVYTHFRCTYIGLLEAHHIICMQMIAAGGGPSSNCLPARPKTAVFREAQKHIRSKIEKRWLAEYVLTPEYRARSGVVDGVDDEEEGGGAGERTADKGAAVNVCTCTHCIMCCIEHLIRVHQVPPYFQIGTAYIVIRFNHSIQDVPIRPIQDIQRLQSSELFNSRDPELKKNSFPSLSV